METETRTFVGEPNTTIIDGWAGFRINQRYTGTIEESGTVRVAVSVMGSVTLKLAEWDKWFRA